MPLSRRSSRLLARGELATVAWGALLTLLAATHGPSLGRYKETLLSPMDQARSVLLVIAVRSGMELGSETEDRFTPSLYPVLLAIWVLFWVGAFSVLVELVRRGLSFRNSRTAGSGSS